MLIKKKHVYFLIPAVIMKICNPIAELAIPPGIPKKGSKEEMETHPVTAEDKARRRSV